MGVADEIARAELEALAGQGLRRQLEPLRKAPGVEIEPRPGERLINFSSNDYLGLAGDGRVAQALAKGAAQWGAGASASRLVVGDFEPHHELERVVAALEGSQAALLFGSGYAANSGLFGAFVQREDLIVSDELNHASIIDGCRLSRARIEVYPHGDLEAAAKLLKLPGRRKLLVTDAVFSMDGDRAPLRELLRLCAEASAMLVVDEAHSSGVIGPRGAGLCVELDVVSDLRLTTLSKAFGVFGAAVSGTHAVRELLVSRARSLLFATGLPPALACAALEAVRISSSPEGDELRARLWRNIRRFAAGLRGLGLGAREESAIFPVLMGSPERAVAGALRLRELGILAKPIRPPTVAVSRLRFALSAAHSEEHVDAALKALREIW
ncbi:MAG TPA: 8-amino-7-oxononanoate synthase [Myxococcales bacterium]|nr:8-amino-7-oxononanoate synthase [Myxococcales bacterium]